MGCRVFYFILLAVIGFIIFKMRHRIIGGIVVSAIFVGVVFFIIFMLDWYVGVDLRQYVNISWYDTTIQNPVKVGEDLVGTARDEVSNYNQQLSQVGQQLDQKFGVEQDDKGVWEDVKTDDEIQESGRDEGTIDQSNKSIFSGSDEGSTYNGEEWVITYDEVDEVVKTGGFTRDDQNLLRTLSPHNPGKFEGETISLNTTRDTITITNK